MVRQVDGERGSQAEGDRGRDQSKRDGEMQATGCQNTGQVNWNDLQLPVFAKNTIHATFLDNCHAAEISEKVFACPELSLQ